MTDAEPDTSSLTQIKKYSERLQASQEAWWRRLLNVQAPYGWNLRRLRPGFTLDVGCGLGRHLLHLRGNGVGIDHNPESLRYAKALGLRVFTPEGFRGSLFNVPRSFDSILLS
ncbi:MAG: class I SAM-dependent methyltransferase, partial [Candidatus Omnitrophica bacterium]|nr:class I SAM-dependent methyltransferase [Candidatus Omnitrophota bacterium]